MITKVFKFLGHGDTMTGMQYSAYGFMAIILLIVISCSIIFTLNFMEERKRMNVVLKSKQAEKKKEENKYGMFNYTIINGEDNSVNDVDITDPKNRSDNNSNNANNGGKHRHHKKRNGLKEVPTRLIVENNAPKVSLINKDGHIESSVSKNINGNIVADNNSFSNDFTFSNNGNNDFQVPEQVSSFDASEFDDSSIEIINTNPVPPQPQPSNNMEDGMPQPEITDQNNSENLNIPATANMNIQSNNVNQAQVQQQPNTTVSYPRNKQDKISDNPFNNFINPNRLSK